MSAKDLKKRICRGEILARMSSRIVILDGAMGTMIQRGKIDSACGCCSVKGNMDMLNITNPSAVRGIHKAYIESGAEIIETNTFNGTAVSQREYGTAGRVYEINFQGAAIALEAACEAGTAFFGPDSEWRSEWGAPRAVVAGVIGPTIKSLTLASDVRHPELRSVSFDEMAEAFAVQAEALIDGGADLLLVESVYDGLNMKAALYAIRKVLEKKQARENQAGNIQTLRGGEFDIPVMLSVTVNDAYGRILTGQTTESLFTEAANYDIISFGLNCSFGAKDLMPCIREIGKFAGNCGISVYPNAGLPDEMGCYRETEEHMAECIREIALEGSLNIAGGCCGTTPEHIRAIAAALKGCAPHPIAPRGTESLDDLYVSGLENLLINRQKRNFTNIGERTNVAGSAKFAGLIRERKFAEAASIAAKQIEDGATVIDINTDDTMADGTELMRSFLRYIANEPNVARVPLMVDSSNWETILEGVKNSIGKPVVNSISLKEGEEEFLRRAGELYDLGAAVVVMAFDEKGQAVTYARKIEICARAYRLLTGIGFSPSDLIFDCNILTIATGMPEHDSYARDYIEAVRWIKKNLPGAKTSGGVSNLSFAFRGNNTVRKAMHSVFLYHAIEAGLDMAIVNPSMIMMYDEIDPLPRAVIEAAVLNDGSYLGRITPEQCAAFGLGDIAGEFAGGKSISEILAALATAIKEKESPARCGGDTAHGSVPGSAASASCAETNSAPGSSEEMSGDIDGMLQAAVIRGGSPALERILHKALETYRRPVDIIEGPLMAGLERVGKLFEEGKMFLPQVVKSARVMKTAVEFLQPFIEEYDRTAASAGSGGEGPAAESEKPVVILATAKGDIHDIGKNILSIVLACNNFEVVDLGVMVENRVILEEAFRRRAALIAVSGLITPSLSQMEELAAMLEDNKERMLRELGYLIPLGVGGATTSSVHTAVKIAPKYSGTVIFGRDASTSAVAYKRVVAGTGEEQIRRRQEEIRRNYSQRNIEQLSVGEAFAAARKYPAESYSAGAFGENNLIATDILLDELRSRIEWSGFFSFWGFKGDFRNLPGPEEEAGKLYSQALAMLDSMAADGSVRAGALLEFYEAYSGADSITLVAGGRRAVFAVPRQTAKGSEYLSLADFVVPESVCGSCSENTPLHGGYAKVGLFAASVEDSKAQDADRKSFGYLLRYSICARLAEALALYLQDFAAKPVEDLVGEGRLRLIRPGFGYGVCPDHSLKRTAFDLLNAGERLGMKLTESNAIIPTTSVCGLLIAHPEARYFDV